MCKARGPLFRIAELVALEVNGRLRDDHHVATGVFENENVYTCAVFCIPNSNDRNFFLIRCLGGATGNNVWS
jgi:hypothetical protein